jgi:hypothetical protein
VDDVEVELLLQQLHEDVVRRTVAGRRIGVLARRLAHRLDPVLHAARRERRVHAQEEVGGAQQRHRRQVLQRVDAGLGDQLWGEAEGGDGGHHQRVAVGGRVGHRARGQQRAGAGPVLDHERLLERALQVQADGAPEQVGMDPGGSGTTTRTGLLG